VGSNPPFFSPWEKVHEGRARDQEFIRGILQLIIRHCVFAKFRPEITPEQKAEIYSGLGALVGRIEGLLRADFGPNISPEGRSGGFEDGFIMDLVDQAAVDRYLADPDHKAAGARLVAALEGGPEGLMIFDMEVSG